MIGGAKVVSAPLQKLAPKPAPKPASNPASNPVPPAKVLAAKTKATTTSAAAKAAADQAAAATAAAELAAAQKAAADQLAAQAAAEQAAIEKEAAAEQAAAAQSAAAQAAADQQAAAQAAADQQAAAAQGAPATPDQPPTATPDQAVTPPAIQSNCMTQLMANQAQITNIIQHIEAQVTALNPNIGTQINDAVMNLMCSLPNFPNVSSSDVYALINKINNNLNLGVTLPPFEALNLDASGNILIKGGKTRRSKKKAKKTRKGLNRKR